MDSNTTVTAAVPSFESPIPIERSDQVAMLATSGVCVVLTFALVILRFVARRKMGRKLDGSDFCILAALFFNTALHVDNWIMVYRGGFGFHVKEIAVRFGPEVLVVFFKCIMSFAMLWCTTTLFTKISILLLYTTLFPVRSMIRSCRIVGAVITVWCVGSILAGLLMCQPFAMNWDRTLPGKCGDNVLYYTLLGVINIISEVVILVLPMPVIYKLELPLHKKITIAGMFGIGFGTCAVTIYRQATLANLDFGDMTHQGLLPTLLSGLEPSVALMLACVPLVRPLFGGTQKLKGSQGGSYYGSGHGTGAGGGGGRSQPTKLGFRDRTSRAVHQPLESRDDINNERNENSSEIQLQPVKVSNNVQISAVADDEDGGGGKGRDDSVIKVERKWEVRSSV